MFQFSSSRENGGIDSTVEAIQAFKADFPRIYRMMAKICRTMQLCVEKLERHTEKLEREKEEQVKQVAEIELLVKEKMKMVHSLSLQLAKNKEKEFSQLKDGESLRLQIATLEREKEEQMKEGESLRLQLAKWRFR